MNTLQQHQPTPKPEQFLPAIFNRLQRGLVETAVQIFDLRQPDLRQPDLRQPAACSTNAAAIQIIKQFEGFPADVEPDVASAEQAVRQLVAVPLTPNQFSALVSFTYHLGDRRFGQSALLKQLNAGRYRAAAQEFERWVYVGASRFPQLAARRVAERRLFLANC